MWHMVAPGDMCQSGEWWGRVGERFGARAGMWPAVAGGGVSPWATSAKFGGAAAHGERRSAATALPP